MRTRSHWFRPSFRGFVALALSLASITWAARVLTEDLDVSLRAERLQSRDRDERFSALLDLSMLVGSDPKHARAAWPIVLRATDDRDPIVRAQALITLSDLAGSYSVLGLTTTDYATARRITLFRLDDTSPEVRAAAVGSLGRLGPIESNALPALSRLSRKPEVMLTRASALEQLGRFRPTVRAAHAAVLTGLSDQDPIVRASAVHSLATWVDLDVRTAKTVVARLEDEDRRVRYAAYEVLRELTPPTTELLPSLVLLISDDELINARIGAELAARMGSNAVSLAPALLEAHLRHEATHADSIFISTIAAVAPKSREADQAISLLKQSLTSGDPNSRIAAAHALADFGGQAISVLPSLRDAMKAAQPELQSEARNAIEAIEHPQPGKDLPEML